MGVRWTPPPPPGAKAEGGPGKGGACAWGGGLRCGESVGNEVARDKFVDNAAAKVGPEGGGLAGPVATTGADWTLVAVVVVVVVGHTTPARASGGLPPPGSP